VGGIDNVNVAKESAFGAMYAFMVTFLVSLVVWYRDARNKRRDLILVSARHVYEQVPSSSSMMHHHHHHFDLATLEEDEEDEHDEPLGSTTTTTTTTTNVPTLNRNLVPTDYHHQDMFT
jgi:hypothetical protein